MEAARGQHTDPSPADLKRAVEALYPDSPECTGEGKIGIYSETMQAEIRAWLAANPAEPTNQSGDPEKEAAQIT